MNPPFPLCPFPFVFTTEHSRTHAQSSVLSPFCSTLHDMLIPTSQVVWSVTGRFYANGTTVLDANLTAHRWFLPLSAASVALLVLTSALALRDLGRACALPPSPRPPAQTAAAG